MITEFILNKTTRLINHFIGKRKRAFYKRLEIKNRVLTGPDSEISKVTGTFIFYANKYSHKGSIWWTSDNIKIILADFENKEAKYWNQGEPQYEAIFYKYIHPDYGTAYYIDDDLLTDEYLDIIESRSITLLWFREEDAFKSSSTK